MPIVDKTGEPAQMQGRAVSVALALLLVALGATPALAFDETAPVLHSATLVTPGPLTAGDTLTVDVDASDESGLNAVEVHYYDSAMKMHSLIGTAAGPLSTVIGDGWANGPVTIDLVFLRDTHDNAAYYYGDGRYTENGSDFSTHAVDLAGLSFTAQSTGQDNDPPVLSSLSFTPPEQAVTGTVLSVDLGLVEDEHGLPRAVISFVDAAGKYHVSEADPGHTPMTVTVDDSWAIGDAHLMSVQLDDHSGNTSSYQADGTLGHSPWTLAPGHHDLDLGPAFPVLTAGYATPPQLLTLARRPHAAYVEGDDVVFDWTAVATDLQPQISVFVADGSGKVHGVASTGGTATLSIDDTWRKGPAKIWMLVADDAHGNRSTYDPRGYSYTTPETPVAPPNLFDYPALGFDVLGPSVAVTSAPAALSRSRSAAFNLSAAKGTAPHASLALSCVVDAAPVACGSGTASVAGLVDGAHHLTATVTDAIGQTGTTTYSWSVDATAPRLTVTPVSAVVAGAFTVVATTTDSGSGVAATVVRWRTAAPAGPWSAVRTGSTVSLRPGDTACYAVTARDRAGNTTSSAVRCVVRPLAAATVLAGPFRQVGAIATTCPACGTVAVLVDGVRVGTLDLRSATRTTRVVTLPFGRPRSGRITLKPSVSGVLAGLLVWRV